ncbi:hypothetical protein WM04_09355 [Burkholderia ubonensis]|uniref:hypothetical protein n=1 Tax=Burkholderia ubonensis TaxID=101571 RepID=UPI0007597047|nr:hypothetical protein [Burkholderia ubonensis]KWI34114.1 hypothetical protein WM04_09355 [Burkholderia ubonensis]OJB12600.1 hypothetical protein BGV53_25865 [Burkholderia ubonensis]
MKSLRIITGFHSGAQLDLPTGIHVIGSRGDDDIRITDWTDSSVELSVVDDKSVHIRKIEHIEGDESAVDTQAHATLADFVPMQFGDIVICVGPANDIWPSDFELLAVLFATPNLEHQPSGRSRYRRWPAVAGVTVCCAVLLASLSSLPSQPAKASAPVDVAVQVQNAVAHAGAQGLAIERDGDVIAVTGMVASYADDARVRRALSGIADARVKRSYSIGENDVQNIEDALGIAGATVTYLGDGIFEIDGTVANLKALNDAVVRVRRDLTSNVKGIIVSATEFAKPEVRQPVSQLISAKGVKYTQTPDGVKHIYASGS